MKRGLITATAVIKILVLYQRVVKRHLKIVSEIIKSCSTTLYIKMIRNYQKNLEKSKSAVEHQKLYGKLSEYAVLITETVSTAFYVK